MGSPTKEIWWFSLRVSGLSGMRRDGVCQSHGYRKRRRTVEVDTSSTPERHCNFDKRKLFLRLSRTVTIFVTVQPKSEW
jgi:hypothetical protein